MQDNEIMRESYYEMEVDGAFYDYYLSLESAKEMAEMLIQENDIDCVDIWQVSKKSELIEAYECG